MSVIISEGKDVSSLLREDTAQVVRSYKSSWVRLGQCLRTIYTDKHFKNWGYLSFEAYCQKELSLKRAVVSKLIQSYSFLEKEEPKLVQDQAENSADAAKIPNMESINLLRLAANNEKIDKSDFRAIKDSVMIKNKEPKDIRAQVREIVLAHDEREAPDEVRRKRRNAVLGRLISSLRSVQREVKTQKILPKSLIDLIADLQSKVEDQIE